MKRPNILIALVAAPAINLTLSLDCHADAPTDPDLVYPIFFDDFDSGSLSAAWTISGSGTNRAQVLESTSLFNNFEVVLDDSVGDTSYSSSQLTFSVNLLDWSGLILDFDAKEFGDESHAPPVAPFSGDVGFDGVSIRVSPDADEWYEIAGLRGLGDSYQSFSIDLDQVLANLGLVPSATVQIRFNQYDNFPAASDGIAIDNVYLRGVPSNPIYAWGLSNELMGDELLPTADPDKDGRTNLEEFALDGNPIWARDEKKTSTFLTTAATEEHLAITLPVLCDAAFSGSSSPSATINGITYTIQGTTDLNDWNAPLTEVIPAESSGLPSLSSGWEYRTFRLMAPSSLHTHAFLRAAIEESN